MANEFESHVRKLLENKGWTVLQNGWPDFLCIKNKQILAVEVKNHGDKLSPRQVRLLSALSEKIPVQTAHPGPGFGDKLESNDTHLLIFNSDTWRRVNRKTATRNQVFDGLGVA